MKIAFLGNFGVDYSSESHYKKTFEKMGHEVITYQEGKHIFGVDDMLLLQGVDMFFWVHTHGWHNVGLDNMISVLKSKNIPIVGYHLDLWLGIEREKDLQIDSYWKAMDYFFCTDALMADWLNERRDKGYPKAFFLPAGVYEDECYYGKVRSEFEHDVIFVGSRGYHPEWPYRKQLIEWLENTYGEKFAQYGGGGKGTIRGDELNDLYASAKIVVGDTLCKGFNYPYYLSDRIFETTGRGGFLIHPYIEGIGDLFTTDQIALYHYGDFAQLKKVIDYYLENEEEREMIRLKGHERTKKDHTYTQRLTKLLETIKNEQWEKQPLD